MTCTKCQKKPELPPAALEIINQCDPVLFHKVIYPAALGDDTTVPPDTLNYKNVLLVYEANEHAYLYSSDGAATFISMAAVDLTAIKEELAQHGIDIDNLKTEVATVQGDVETLQNSLAEETQNRQDADENLQDQITINTQNISSLNTTVASQGEQITNLETNLQDTTTELQTDIANETLARTEADDTLQSNIDAINTNLNQEVEKETDFTTDTSTVTVQHTKVNLSNNDTNITTDPLPVASETQAGVMNTATYQAVQNNAEDIDTILNGAVALEGLSATATQEDLTNAWKEATGKTDIVNRASIYDIDNDKVWYYYSNINEWKPLTASTDGDVNISTFTNTTAGIIKGSENDGQLFAEADGTGSVVGWDGLKHDVENLVELIETNPIPKLYDVYSTEVDGANTAAFIDDKLNNKRVVLGSGATGNTSSYLSSDRSIAIGTNAKTSYSLSSPNYNIAIGTNATAVGESAGGLNGIAVGLNTALSFSSGTTAPIAIGTSAKAGYDGVAIGNSAEAKSTSASVALGERSKTSRGYEVSIGSGPSGSAPRTRYLANVTAGTLDTDAVNKKQMEDYVAAAPTTKIYQWDWIPGEPSHLQEYFDINIDGATPLNVGQSILFRINFGTTPDGYRETRYVRINNKVVTIVNAKSSDQNTLTAGNEIFTLTLLSPLTDEQPQVAMNRWSLDYNMTPAQFNAAWEAA